MFDPLRNDPRFQELASRAPEKLIRLTDLIERQPNWNARGGAQYGQAAKAPKTGQACRAASWPPPREARRRPGLNRVGGFISIQERQNDNAVLSKYSSSGTLTLQKARRTVFCRQLCAGWFLVFSSPPRGTEQPFQPWSSSLLRVYYAGISRETD